MTISTHLPETDVLSVCPELLKSASSPARTTIMPLPAVIRAGIRTNQEHFHGYVNGKNHEAIIRPTGLKPIECGLGSSLIQPKGIDAQINYPHPYAADFSRRILTDIKLADSVDPDQVIVRTSHKRIVDEIARTLPEKSAPLVYCQSDQEIFELPEGRVANPKIIVKNLDGNKGELLVQYAEHNKQSVIFVDASEDIQIGDIARIYDAAMQNNHLLVLHDPQGKYKELSENDGHVILTGTRGEIGYAILPRPLFDAYNNMRMVFMLPRHRMQNPESKGSSHLEKQMGRHLLGRYGLPLPNDRVYWGEGSYDVLDQMIGVLPFDRVVGLGAHFPYIKQHALRNGKKYQAFQHDHTLDFGNNLQAFKEFIREEESVPSILYIDIPSNPSGHVYAVQEVEEFLRVAQEKGHFVLLDLAYGDLMLNVDDYYRLVNTYSNLSVLGSFSKSMGMAGERIGYGIMGETVSEIMNRSKITSPVTPKTYQLISSVLDPETMYSHLEESRALVEKGKEALINSFRQVNAELDRSCPGIKITIASTHPSASILYARIEGADQLLEQSGLKQLGVSVGKILSERWRVTCEAGEEFADTHPLTNITGFRLRIPSDIHDAPEVASRVFYMLYELVHDPQSVTIQQSDM